MDSKAFKEFAELKSLKRQLSAKMAELDETIAKREVTLLDQMATEGFTSIRVDTSEGSYTISPRRTISATAEEGQKEELIKRMESLGLRDLVTLNYRSLSSWVREHQEIGKPLPKKLEGLIRVNEIFHLGVVKANGK